MKLLRFCAFIVFLAVFLGTAGIFAQTRDRKKMIQNRKGVIDFLSRHGTLVKGMTKGEVLEVYGRPDKRFTYSTANGRIEQWTYYFPRKRSVVPWRNSEFSGRFRFLYFKDDILVNFER